MNPFSTWTLLAGGLVVSCGWLILLTTIHRALRSRRTRRLPPRSTAVAAGRVYPPRAAFEPGRGTPVLPVLPAASTPPQGGGGYRLAVPVSPPTGYGRPSSRLDGACEGTPRRAPVAAPPLGDGAATLQFPARPKDLRSPMEIRRAGP